MIFLVIGKTFCVANAMFPCSKKGIECLVALIYNVRHGISRFVLFYEHVNRCDIQPVQGVFLGENFWFTVNYESKLVSIFPQKCQILLTAVFFFRIQCSQVCFVEDSESELHLKF